jgi:hypothetical protein
LQPITQDNNNYYTRDIHEYVDLVERLEHVKLGARFLYFIDAMQAEEKPE